MNFPKDVARGIQKAAAFAVRYVPNLASAITKLRDAVEKDEGVTLDKDETWALLEALKSIRDEKKKR